MILVRVAARLNRVSLTKPSSSVPIRCLASIRAAKSLFHPLDTFSERHIGPDDQEVSLMLSTLGYDSMDAFVDATVPSKIRVPPASISDTSISSLSEVELHVRAKTLSAQNQKFKSYIGMGYHNAVVPTVILRNVGPSSSRIIIII